MDSSLLIPVSSQACLKKIPRSNHARLSASRAKFDRIYRTSGKGLGEMSKTELVAPNLNSARCRSIGTALVLAFYNSDPGRSTPRMDFCSWEVLCNGLTKVAARDLWGAVASIRNRTATSSAWNFRVRFRTRYAGFSIGIRLQRRIHSSLRARSLWHEWT